MTGFLFSFFKSLIISLFLCEIKKKNLIMTREV